MTLAPRTAACLLATAVRRVRLRVSEPRALEFNPDQPRDDAGRWVSDAAIDALPAHPDKHLAEYGYVASPLKQEGGPSEISAWTGAKTRVESAMRSHGGFAEQLPHATPDTVEIDSLRSYQTRLYGPTLKYHASKRDGHDAVVFTHEGVDWIVDGNHRLAVKKLAGETHANVLRLHGVPRAAAFNPDQPRDENGRWTVAPGAVRSSKFDEAAAFVKEHYTAMLGPHVSITLVPKGSVTVRGSKTNGTTVRNIKIENNKPARNEVGELQFSGKYSLTVSDRRSTAQDYVATIVHELQHVRQHEEGRKTDEAEAYTVGNEAGRKFFELKRGNTRHLVSAKYPVRDAADTHHPKISVAVRFAFAVARKTLHRTKNVDRTIRSLEVALRDVLPKTLEKALIAGARAAESEIRAAGEFRTAKRTKSNPIGKIAMRFDAERAESRKWAKKYAGELITDISETTRTRIKTIIARVGDLNEAIDDIATAIGDEDRAEVIARTESMRVAHEGQRMLWEQAIEDGLLPEDARRTWITTPDDRLCPICEALDGKEAEFDGEYDDDIELPPAHPNCRCTEGLAL